MKNLTGSPSVFPAQRSLETGDDLDEATIEEAFQDAADRTQYLVQHVAQLENLTLIDGVQRLRAVTGSSGLKALSGMATGDVSLITFASPSIGGLFLFKAGDVLPSGDIAGWAYAANDASGVWYRSDSPLMVLGGAGGNQPRLNPDRIRAPNSIVAILETVETLPNFREVASTSGLFEDSGFALGSNLFTAGDKVKILATFSANTTGNSGMKARLAVSNGVTTTDLAGSEQFFDTNDVIDTMPMCLAALWTVPASGAWDIKVLVQSEATASVKLYRDRRIEAMVIRP